jgi:DNA-directed RNA polymerase specialized sigma subunit
MIEISKSETDAVKYITMIITFQKRYKYSKFHKEMQIGKTYHYDNLDFLTTNEFEEEIDNEKLTKDVTNILDNIYPTINITLPLLRYFYNEYQKKLFKMYYFDKLKLKEISTLTDIKVGAISRSIVSTKKRIKKRLKNDYNYSIKLN